MCALAQREVAERPLETHRVADLHLHDHGHTARPLHADRFDVASYLLVLLAAVVRVGEPLVAPAWWLQAIGLSAGLWSAGFGLYALRYWPVLSRPRLDGAPG
ncbi:MAG TPA: NnrS family protein [Caldimonas sp.]|nr:NnrS family protein [Caldimonas sp.]